MIKRVNKLLISKLKKLKISEKYLKFSVFLVLSTLLWFLNALDSQYITELNYKINFINFPDKKKLISNPDIKITVKISASGYDILGKIEKEKKIDLNIKKYAINYYSNEDSNKYYILTDIIKSKIYSTTKSQVKILNISPDSLILQMSETISREIKIIPKTEISFAPMYMQSDKIIVIPDSIKISGLTKDIKNIKFLYTKKISKLNIEDSLSAFYEINSPDNIICKPNKVKIIIPSERYTENEISVPVEIENLPDSLKMITFPEKVKVTYKVGMSKYKKIQNSDFKAGLKFQLIENKLPNKFKVTLNKYPEYIKSIQIEPEYIDYIIKKQ